MDTARYRAFLMASDTGSIRSAADILGYTSSGVSQLIHALESELNVTLFLRGKKGVTLTAAGEALLPVIQNLISQENHVLQLAADMNGTVSGTVNIASYHGLANAWMPDVISAFQKTYPKVRVNLYEGTQQDIMERLQSGKSDIAFFNNSTMSGKYDWIPLLDDPMLAVVPASHPMANATVFPVDKFVGERFIMPEHGYDFDVLDILSEFKITPDVYLSTLDTYILLEMVKKELGISMINGTCLYGRKNDGKLSVIPLTPARSIQMGIAVLSLKDATPAVQKFTELARTIIKNIDLRNEFL